MEVARRPRPSFFNTRCLSFKSFEVVRRPVDCVRLLNNSPETKSCGKSIIHEPNSLSGPTESIMSCKTSPYFGKRTRGWDGRESKIARARVNKLSEYLTTAAPEFPDGHKTGINIITSIKHRARAARKEIMREKLHERRRTQRRKTLDKGNLIKVRFCWKYYYVRAAYRRLDFLTRHSCFWLLLCKSCFPLNLFNLIFIITSLLETQPSKIMPKTMSMNQIYFILNWNQLQ
jgi:hypothetical protein